MLAELSADKIRKCVVEPCGQQRRKDNKEYLRLLEQIRTIDKQRLGQWVCSLDRKTLQAIDEALCVSLGLEWG